MADARAPLRLAMFTDTYAPQLNGVARTLARLTDAVRARGGDVHVITTTDPDAPRDGDDVTRWPSVPCPRYPSLRLARPRAREAARLLDAFGPTLVHVATPFGVGVTGRRVARARGLPLVSSYHTHFGAYAAHYGLGVLAEPTWRYLRWFHNGGARTFVPTPSIATALGARGFDRLAVWGRGIDGARFSPHRRDEALRASWGVERDDVAVAYVGRLAPEKGLDLLVDAMRIVYDVTGAADGRSRVRLVFVGEGPHEHTLRARAPEGTIFTGRLEGTALAAAFASADVFAFPSQTDTFGNVLLEAMASGVAICAVDAPPTRDLLGDGARGAIASPDARALAGLLAELIASRARRAAFALDGLAYAATQSWDAIFDGLMDDYEHVRRSVTRS